MNMSHMITGGHLWGRLSKISTLHLQQNTFLQSQQDLRTKIPSKHPLLLYEKQEYRGTSG